MMRAADNVSTGSITFAARHSDFENRNIHEGDILALDNGKLSFTDTDIEHAAVKGNASFRIDIIHDSSIHGNKCCRTIKLREVVRQFEGGIDSKGQSITTAETSFMMIPQQLFTGAEIQVDFTDATTGKSVNLRASIQGDVWEMNTTTNYYINIDGNYNISIVPIDKVLDSHYIITKVEVSSDYPIWQVTATANDGADVTVQLEQDVNSLAKQGFWTDKIASKDANGNIFVSSGAQSARGTNTCGGSTIVNKQVLYVFIPENISGETRDIVLTMTAVNSSSTDYAIKTLTLQQQTVKWMKDPNNSDSYWGCELLIEGGQVPWGFYWKDKMEFDLAQGGTTKPQGGNIAGGRKDAFIAAMSLIGVSEQDLFNQNNYVKIHEAAKQNGNQNATWFITIDLSKLINLFIAPEVLNGEKNTKDIYQWKGISYLNSVLSFLVNWDGLVTPEGKDLTEEHIAPFLNTLDYAAMYAMKRNRFHYYEETVSASNGGSSIMIIPYIDVEKDLNWYLPAKNQFPYFKDLDWGQSFSFDDLYWTSTAYNKTSDQDPNNAHAYAILNGIETISHREQKYLTFALRRYLNTSDVEIPIKPEDVITPGGGNGPEYGEGGNGNGNTGGDISGNS